jgi:hypothetical protein
MKIPSMERRFRRWWKSLVWPDPDVEGDGLTPEQCDRITRGYIESEELFPRGIDSALQERRLERAKRHSDGTTME